MRAIVDLALILYISVTAVAPFFVFYAVAIANPEVPLSVDWWFRLLPAFMALPGVLVARSLWSLLGGAARLHARRDGHHTLGKGLDTVGPLGFAHLKNLLTK
jgi:hypothetical protein